MITSSALKAGFSGGLVVDYPNSFFYHNIYFFFKVQKLKKCI